MPRYPINVTLDLDLTHRARFTIDQYTEQMLVDDASLTNAPSQGLVGANLCKMNRCTLFRGTACATLTDTNFTGRCAWDRNVGGST